MEEDVLPGQAGPAPAPVPKPDPAGPSYITSTLSKMAAGAVFAYLLTCVGTAVMLLVLYLMGKELPAIQQSMAAAAVIIGWEWRMVEFTVIPYLTARGLTGAAKK